MSCFSSSPSTSNACSRRNSSCNVISKSVTDSAVYKTNGVVQGALPALEMGVKHEKTFKNFDVVSESTTNSRRNSLTSFEFPNVIVRGRGVDNVIDHIVPRQNSKPLALRRSSTPVDLKPAKDRLTSKQQGPGSEKETDSQIVVNTTKNSLNQAMHFDVKSDTEHTLDNGNVTLAVEGDIECHNCAYPEAMLRLSPEAKRRKTGLEKSCGLWEGLWDGFESLRPARPLTVSE